MWAEETKTADIKRAVPTDAFLAVYAQHNPARDYQREYFAAAWKTFQEEQIGPRLLGIVTSRVPEDKLATAKSKVQELQTALEPISVQALINADEIVMAEAFEGPFNQVFGAVRLNASNASDCERGFVQAFELLSRWSEGKVSVQTSRVKGASITALSLPKESPYQPAVARLNDIVLVCTSADLLRRSVEQLQDESAKSKFDDPRLQEALKHLPKPSDSLVFFDGQRLFQNLRGLTDFIRGQAKNDQSAMRIAKLMDRVFDATAILDYEVTVEYTEPGQNRKVALGKLAYNYQDKLLGRALSQSKPIDNWQSWVPKDATAFTLSSGINLHELYEGIIKLVQEEFPESQKGFDKLAAVQEQIGVNFDRDIFQSFSGESMSVTFPVKAADGSTRDEWLSGLKCSNPDKIGELLARGLEAVNKLPALQTQQFKFDDLDDLKGFKKLHAAIFQVFGLEPVVGFREGWMIVASSQAAVEKVLAVKAGQAESIASDSSFEKLGLDVKGAVYCVSYRDIGASVQHAAETIDKIGAMAPMFLGMAAANAKPEELKPVQEAIGLLPSVAKVVRKFDFFGHNLNVIRQGPLPGTYLRESVTEVRMPNEAH